MSVQEIKGWCNEMITNPKQVVFYLIIAVAIFIILELIKKYINPKKINSKTAKMSKCNNSKIYLANGDINETTINNSIGQPGHRIEIKDGKKTTNKADTNTDTEPVVNVSLD